MNTEHPIAVLAPATSYHARKRMLERGIPWSAVLATLRQPWLERPSRDDPGRRLLFRPAVIRGRWRWLSVVIAAGRRTVVVTAFTLEGRRREEVAL